MERRNRGLRRRRIYRAICLLGRPVPGTVRSLPRKDGELDYAALAGELKRLKRSYPDKTDVQVLSADAIRFESLIKTMDAAMASGFPDISLLDAASGAP